MVGRKRQSAAFGGASARQLVGSRRACSLGGDPLRTLSRDKVNCLPEIQHRMQVLKRLSFACLALAAVFTALPSPAQDWPNRPVRIINTFAAGGTADVLARSVADHLSNTFGQQFYVETRAGAGGAIGVQAVVNTPPDGYNFVITNVSLLALAPTSNPRLGYDPRRDLTNIAYIAGSPVVLSVNAASGMKTLADFIARSKTSDKPLTY